MYYVVNKRTNETLYSSVSWTVCDVWIRRRYPENHEDYKNIEVITDEGVKVF